MARTVSWFPRLPELARSVSNSVRSHYSSADLERLFQIQPRSAQMLMGILPTVAVGKSLLVEREALCAFLSRLISADDPALELSEIRRCGKPAIIHRKLRDLIRTDAAPGQGLPGNVHLARGALAISFSTVEELANALWQFSVVLDADLDGFAEKYEPLIAQDSISTEQDQLEKQDMAYITAFLSKNFDDGPAVF